MKSLKKLTAGGHVAATRIDCPCGESFMKIWNDKIKCPKEKRIESLESAMKKLVQITNQCTEKENYDGYEFECIALAVEYEKLLGDDEDT